MDDVGAVMDAASCEIAAVVGISEGGPMGVAVRRDPSRAGQRSGALRGPSRAYRGPRTTRPESMLRRPSGGCDQIEEVWGQGLVWPMISVNDAPDDEETRAQLARFERAAANSGDGRGGQPLRLARRRSSRSVRHLGAHAGRSPQRRSRGRGGTRALPRRAHTRSPNG